MVDNSGNERTYETGAKTGKRSGFEPAADTGKNRRMTPEVEEELDERISGTYNRRRETLETLDGDNTSLKTEMVRGAVIVGTLIVGAAVSSKLLDVESRPNVMQGFEAVETVDSMANSAARNFVDEVQEHIPSLVVGTLAVGVVAIKLWQELKEWTQEHKDNDIGNGR